MKKLIVLYLTVLGLSGLVASVCLHPMSRESNTNRTTAASCGDDQTNNSGSNQQVQQQQQHQHQHQLKVRQSNQNGNKLLADNINGRKVRDFLQKISINGSQPVYNFYRTLTSNQFESSGSSSINNNQSYYALGAGEHANSQRQQQHGLNESKELELISIDLRDTEIPLTSLWNPSNTETVSTMASMLISGGNVVRFSNNHLTVSNVNIESFNVQLNTSGTPKLDARFLVGSTKLYGEFSFTGQLMTLDVKLYGTYRAHIKDTRIKASTKLVKTTSNTTSDRGHNGNNIVAQDFNLNITNMGYVDIQITPTNENSYDEYWVRLLNSLLQKTAKRTYFMFENEIKRALVQSTVTVLNDELTALQPYLGAQTSQMQDIVGLMRDEIVKLGLVSVPLPNHELSQQMWGLQAKINFTHGRLNGLDTIRITNMCKIKIEGQHLLITTSFGWSNLMVDYQWMLYVGAQRMSLLGSVSFVLKEIEFDAVIIHRMLPFAKPTLDTFNITRLDSITMDITGLPTGMNSVTRSMVNLYMRRMKHRIINTVQSSIKEDLESVIQKIDIF